MIRQVRGCCANWCNRWTVFVWLSIDDRLTDTTRYQLTNFIDWYRLIDWFFDHRFPSIAYPGLTGLTWYYGTSRFSCRASKFHSRLPNGQGPRLVVCQISKRKTVNYDLPRASKIWELLVRRTRWISSFFKPCRVSLLYAPWIWYFVHVQMNSLLDLTSICS